MTGLRPYGSCQHCHGALTKSMERIKCPRCGRAQRDPGPRYDPKVLEAFVRSAARHGKAHADEETLLDVCTRRLEIGEREYGATQFWSADCVKEAGEEGVDAINWSFFDYTKSLASKDRTDVDDDGRDLALIAACGASIFAAANRIRARRQEE